MKPKLTPQRVAEALRLARKGYTLRQISAELGNISYESVRRYLRAAGFTPLRRPASHKLGGNTMTNKIKPNLYPPQASNTTLADRADSMTTPDIHNMTAAEIAVSIQTAQIAHLQAQNAELLAALEQIAERIAGGFPGYQKESALYELGCKAQNAIARAKGDA